MLLSMRMYICYATALFCLVLSIGECKDKSSTPPLWRRIGARLRSALDTTFAALFIMNAPHVQEAYEVARIAIRNMNTD